jgi:predicted signal transduction protein with EAL and GGDEF domain
MLRRAVGIICEATGWPVGLVYTSSSEERRMLQATEIGHVADAKRFGSFAGHYRPGQRARSGDPARRALAARAPIWIEDVRKDPGFRRAKPAEETGLGASVAFPLEIDGRIAAVFEFFAGEALPRDQRMLEYLRQIATQIGRAAQRVQMLEQVHALASFDSLTGLPNRWSFQQRLHAAIELAQRHEHRLAILFLDLDGFKAVNDTLGHDVGDRLLTAVASRLSRTVRTRDCVARDDDGIHAAERGVVSRLAGDEFMILLPQIPSGDVAKKVAQRILGSLRSPFDLEGRELFTDASIGIALYPDHGVDMSTLIRSADIAMYQAKSRGRSNFQFFDGTLGSPVARRLTLYARLRRAVESEEFELHYQPVRHVRLGHVVGVEALLRWQDSELGRVAPVEFVAAAEQCGQIGVLGAWVLRTVAAQARCWIDAGLRPIRIAVNISGHQLRHPSILETIREALGASALGAGWLELELTESTIIQDDELTNAILREISELGVGLALDDFGTGYSSLSNLRRLPIGRVKIDRSFVADLPRSPDDCAVVGAIIAMAHSLRIPVVAEGVETEEQLEFLRQRGCEEVQGYLFSPAVPPEALARMLEREKEDGLAD